MSPNTLRMIAIGLIGLGAVGCHSSAKSHALTSAPPTADAKADARNVPAPPPVPKFQPGDFVEGYRQPGPSYAPLTVPKDARMVKVE
jgi:hypothetical protein